MNSSEQIDLLKAEAVAADIRIANDATVIAALKQESIDNAKMMLLLTEDLQYIAGIVEKGRGQPTIDGNLTVRSAILGYVQELEAKLAALAEDVVTEEMKMAVRWAPSSAYWSTVLVNHFGPDARDGINWLEKQLREKIAAAGAAPVPGWQLVPVEPTPEMIEAMARAWQNCVELNIDNECYAEYKAMLEAAPKGEK